MNYEKENIVLFNPSGCLTDEALQLYVYKKADDDMNYKIESHLNECQLCKNAVEGVKILTSSNYRKSVSDIKRKIEKKYVGNAKRRSFENIPIKRITFYASASIILIVAFFSYLNLEKDIEIPGKRKLLGDNIVHTDSLTYFSILGYTESELDREEEALHNETIKTKEDRVEQKIVIDNLESEENSNNIDIKTYIVKNDMIIRENTPPELLQAIKCPFKVFVREKIDSLLIVTPLPIKYDVTAEFVISKEGLIKYPRILSSSNSKVDSFTVKVLEHSPKWKPATINNTPVDYPVKIKITNYH